MPHGENDRLGALLDEAVARGASDLHVGAGMPPAMRVEGELAFLDGPPLASEELERALGDRLTPEQAEKFAAAGELDFALTHTTAEGTEARFRGNCYRERRGLAVAFRYIPARARTLDELGLPEALKAVARRRSGLFLMTGPAGQGKTTALAALVHEIDAARCAHIITIEDPIEFIHSPARCLIHQREVGTDSASFAAALRSALRQDPDVLLIGELRDLETISAAITAAETGHLVLGTLHTQDAPQSIERLIDVFPPHQQPQVRVQLSLTLAGVCSLRLVPRLGGGRACATELLFATPAVRNCIREGRTGQIRALIQTGASSGMHTMEQCLAGLARDGAVAREAVIQWEERGAEDAL